MESSKSTRCKKISDLPMAKVEFYCTPYCPFCIRAKMLLKSKKVAFDEIRVDLDASKRKEMMQRGGQHTVPQIFIDDASIGGCDELYHLERAGKLDGLLNA